MNPQVNGFKAVLYFDAEKNPYIVWDLLRRVRTAQILRICHHLGNDHSQFSLALVALMGVNTSTSQRGQAAFDAEKQFILSEIMDGNEKALRELDPKRRTDLLSHCSHLYERLEYLKNHKMLTDDYSMYGSSGSGSRQNSSEDEKEKPKQI